MTFESMARCLDSMNLEQVELNGTIFYFIGNKVVATRKNDLIVMYFQCNRRIIENSLNKVSVAFAKDFLLSKDFLNLQTDAISISGLYGTFNTFKVVANRHLVPFTDNTLSFGKEKGFPIFQIGTIGFVPEIGLFHFYDYKTFFTVPANMCKIESTKRQTTNVFPLRDATFIIR